MIPVSYETHKAAGDHAGELCLWPVGLALVTRMAPVSMAAMLMGVRFLSSFAANLLAGYLAGMLESEESRCGVPLPRRTCGLLLDPGRHPSRPECCCSGSRAGCAV